MQSGNKKDGIIPINKRNIMIRDNDKER